MRVKTPRLAPGEDLPGFFERRLVCGASRRIYPKRGSNVHRVAPREGRSDGVSAGRRDRKPVTHHGPEVDVTHALEEVTVPAYVIDRDGRIRWLNRGAMTVLGDRVGQRFTRTVAPEDLHLAAPSWPRS